MTFNISGLGDREALAQIARMAYGSGSSEKTSGGKGNIGLCLNHAVKFNTHWYERVGTPSGAKLASMQQSCNELRTRLSGIATAMLSAGEGTDPAARAKLDEALANVRRQLGMDATGANVATTSLLERRVVASVINVIRDATGFDAWQGLRDVDENALSSKGKVTKFGQAEWSAFVAEEVQHHVQLALDDIAHPADGKPGVVLNEKAKVFLMELIERDVCGHDTPYAVVGSRIRDFTSPYLAVTLQAFNLDTHALTEARPGLNAVGDTMVFLSGSPRKERADRADIALSLLAAASPNDRLTWSHFAMALVSEKMPEMRRIQPNGRLTGATVWKACFGENVPKALTSELAFGRREFSDAFFSRLCRMGDDLLAKCGGNKNEPEETFSQNSAHFLPYISAGMGFTASIRMGAQHPFRMDAARDFVAAPTLYKVEDARVMTEAEVRSQLKKDFYRDVPTIRLHDGQGVETFDFAATREDVKRQVQGLTGEQRGSETDAKFREKTDAFVTAFDARYGTRMTEIQRKVVLIGLMQAAHMPFNLIDRLKELAHRKMTMDIRREDDGAFVISYASDRDRANEFDVRYSYRIEPDGTNFRGNEFTCDVGVE